MHASHACQIAATGVHTSFVGSRGVKLLLRHVVPANCSHVDATTDKATYATCCIHFA